jgi:hypothetical protein
LFGINVEIMIHGDPFEFRVRERIVRRALELRQELDDAAAVAIVNRLAESMKKGQSGS